MKISRRTGILVLLPATVMLLTPGAQTAASGASLFSEGFEGAIGPLGLPDGWRLRPADGGQAAVAARPEGAGRCLHLKTPGRGSLLVTLPPIRVRPGRSYLFQWETRADGVWANAGLRIGTNKGPVRADGTSLSGTDAWSRHELHIFASEDETELRVALSMSGDGDAWFDNFRLEPYEWPTSRRLPDGTVFALQPAGEMQVYYNYPIVRVAPSHRLPASVAQAEGIHIECAANEREAFQLMLRPPSDIAGLKASVSELRGPAKIPSSAWEIFQVGIVPVRVEKAYHTTSLLEETPDPLLPTESFDLKAGGWSCLWIQMETPADAPAGTYRGTLSLAGPIEADIPIEVELFEFRLPARPSLDESAGFRTHVAAQGSGLDEAAVRRLAIELYRRDRIDWPRLFGIMAQESKWVWLEGGDVVIDFAAFDGVVEAYHKLGFRWLDIPPTGLRARGPGGPRMRPWLGLTPLTDEFDRAFGDYIARLGAHLKEKGWLDISSIYLWDEPQEQEYADYLRVARVVRDAFPELRINMGGPRLPAEGLYGFVDIWFPNMRWYSLDCYAQRITERQALGEIVGGYGNNRYNLDYPLLFQRLWPWVLKLYGLTSHGWWEIAGWSANPYERSDMPVGGRRDAPTNTPGAAYFLYPPVSQGGPLVSSMRWEMLRQGREDYEYFTILEKLLDEREGPGKGRARIRELIRQAAWGSLDWQYSQDPLLPHELRRQVARQIAGLSH